jgi:hypothetical protein
MGYQSRMFGEMFNKISGLESTFKVLKHAVKVDGSLHQVYTYLLKYFLSVFSKSYMASNYMLIVFTGQFGYHTIPGNKKNEINYEF